MRKAVLALLLAACSGDGVRHTPDATMHDGPVTPDAPVDAAPTPVTITTTSDGSPVGGVHVYFQNADNTVVLATVTDSTGMASAVMAPGGYVTAINPYTPLAVTNDEIDTFLGVKPGDHLKLATHLTSTSVTVTVTAPLDPAANVGSYDVFTPCGSSALTIPATGGPPSATMPIYNCAATTDFLIVSYDNSTNPQPLDFFFVPNVAAAAQSTIDFTAHTYGAVSTRNYTMTNPGTLSGFSFTDSLLSTGGQIFSFYGYNNVDATSGSYLVPAFTGAADLMATSVFAGGSEEQFFLDWGPYAATYTVDAGARLLPVLQGSPAFDPTTHTFSFTTDATGTAPDFVFGSVNAFRTADGRSWTWRVAAPYATSVVYPTLPTDVYDYNITAADSPGNVQLLLGKVPGGYDAVRPVMLADSSNFQLQQFVMGATGSATLERYALLVRGKARAGDRMVGHAPASVPRLLSHRVR